MKGLVTSSLLPDVTASGAARKPLQCLYFTRNSDVVTNPQRDYLRSLAGGGNVTALPL